MNRKQYIIVEHRQPGQVQALKSEINNLKAELKRQKEINQDIVTKYGYEVYLNGELIDLLRTSQIPFRATLEHSRRMYPEEK